ncbi:ubiquitin-conjugating enzyme/RWD-like protein [Glomus cerebriforme]|uniref:Ubiquitin-conjugating enzyme/RWD-like protein n=1 Tax=Glomus cerebriforme TaxID=658196 RepID=A0A397TIB3_9GLOM|nr:ubiquitin-conjugating enzyme/RWD-like protein [Glomus cerebriforme]
MAEAVARRLLKELKDYQKEPNPDLAELSPISDDNLLIWKAVLRGEPDTPYEGHWILRIEIPKTYPIHPPKIKFLTKICHPNISFKTGEICLDILKTAWSPAWTLQSACMAIRLLLSNPEPTSPLNCDAANLLRCGDFMGYESLVKMYTQLYAMNQQENEASS